MKKIIISLLALISISMPVLAETGKAKVKAGPIKVNVDNAKESQLINITRAGDSILFGCNYGKSKINGINSRVTGVVFSLNFDSIEGDLEEGAVYDLSQSNPTALTSLVTLSRLKNLKGLAITTITDELADETVVSTGKLKVTSYDPNTGLISGNLSVKVSPVFQTNGRKSKVNKKGVKIKVNFKGLTL